MFVLAAAISASTAAVWPMNAAAASGELPRWPGATVSNTAFLEISSEMIAQWPFLAATNKGVAPCSSGA